MWQWQGDWGSGDWSGTLVMVLFAGIPFLLLGFALTRASTDLGTTEDEARRACERFQQVMQDLHDHSAP